MGQLKVKSALLLSGAALVLASPALAQGATELDPIVIEQAKKETDATTVKQDKTTTKVSRTVLQQRMAEDFEDVGRRVDAGVNFNSNNKSVNIRGLQDERVLTTIDGIRVPWLADPRDSAKGGLNAFDFDGLSGLDIAKGADSSRYGSGALGGIVQLRTLDPEDLIEEGKNFGGVVKGGYDSADESWRTNAAVAGRANDTWLLVQGGYREGHETDNFGTVGGYGSARTVPNPKDYDQANLLVKLHQYVEGGHRFGLTGEIANRKDDFENMSGTTSSYVPGTFSSGEEVDRKRISAEYSFESPDKSDVVDRANLIVYWLDQNLNATTDAVRLPDARSFIIPGDPFFYGYPTGIYKRDNWIRQTNYGLTGAAEETVDLGGLSNTFRFGGEIYGQNTTQYSSGIDNCPDVDWSTIPEPFGPQSCRFLHTNSADMPDVDSLVVGVFVEDDIKAVDDRLTITPGIRFDWYDHSPQSTPEFERSLNYDPAYLVSNSDIGISPKLRAAWQATERLELFAQWAQGFRAPSAIELYQNYANAGLYARVGNPDLESETSNGFEVGAAYEADTYSVSANIFNNYYRDFIEENVSYDNPEFPLGVTQSHNVARAHIYGAEVRGQININSNWRAWGSLAWTQGEATDEDPLVGKYKLSSVAPLKAILGVGYSTETWGADVSATLVSSRRGNYGRPTPLDSEDELDDPAAVNDPGRYPGFDAPGYGIVDATIWWTPSPVKGLKVQAGVYNLFDQKYWNVTDVPDNSPAPPDRLTEAGRSFRLAITQKF